MTADLFHVETSLSRLHAQRDDLISEMQVAPTVDDQIRIGNAIEAIEGLIRDEAQPNSVRKVDNFRGYILHLEMLEAAAKKEKQTQAAHEKQARDTIDFMKRIAAATMEATGKDRLEGTLGHIRFQKNGGADPPPLISQPEMVPDSLCRMEGWVNQELWDLAVDLVRTSSKRGTRINDYSLKRTPDPALIRAELEKPCGACNGNGKARGGCICWERSCECAEVECTACGGTGKNAVPGCSLQQRGSHVRVA